MTRRRAGTRLVAGPASLTSVAMAVSIGMFGWACSGGPGPGSVVGPVTPADGLPPGVIGTSRLYRVRYDGPEGDASLRLTLRLASAERWSAAVADRLGRSLWRLEVGPDRVLWVDHRAMTWCTGLPRLPLPGFGSDERPDGELPPESLPRLLLGLLPVPLVERQPGEGLDALRRRWTFTRGGGGELASWTLWSEGEPEWWWHRDDEGGVLSQRREGRQLAWYLTAVGEAGGARGQLRVPESYREDCS